MDRLSQLADWRPRPSAGFQPVRAVVLDRSRYKTPREIYGSTLFDAIQTSGIFNDSKTFVDCVPKDGKTPSQIKADFYRESRRADFDLKSFVYANFEVPQRRSAYTPDASIPIDEHVLRMWSHLTLPPQAATEYSSLLPFAHPHVVPSVRFREPYYWDSFFTIRGIVADAKRLLREGDVPKALELIKLASGMVQNFADMIDEYGFVPNGGRTYYLDRSQPPVFALMVRELSKMVPSAMETYLPQMKLENAFWRDGQDQLKPGQAHRRVVMLDDGSVLSRHWSDNEAALKSAVERDQDDDRFGEDVSEPSHLREEGFHVDWKIEQNAGPDIATELKAAAETGHDFSARRWARDSETLETTRTTEILPIGLNSLLYMNERIIAKAASQAGDRDSARYYGTLAAERKRAMRKHMWDPELRRFSDYDWTNRQRSPALTSDTTFPLFARMASARQARGVTEAVRKDLLVPAGIRTTEVETGEQWDNRVWAPTTMIAVEGLDNYGTRLGRLAQTDRWFAGPLRPIAAHFVNERGRLADTIARRFVGTVENVYRNTGELWEKYLPEGKVGTGGEYHVEPGFGWTNAVWRVLKDRKVPRQEQNGHRLAAPRPFRLKSR